MAESHLLQASLPWAGQGDCLAWPGLTQHSSPTSRGPKRLPGVAEPEPGAGGAGWQGHTCQLQLQPLVGHTGWKAVRKATTPSSELRISTLNRGQKQIGSQHSFWQTGDASPVVYAAKHKLTALARDVASKTRDEGIYRHRGPPGNTASHAAPLLCGWRRDVAGTKESRLPSGYRTIHL